MAGGSATGTTTVVVVVMGVGAAMTNGGVEMAMAPMPCRSPIRKLYKVADAIAVMAMADHLATMGVVTGRGARAGVDARATQMPCPYHSRIDQLSGRVAVASG